MKQCLQFLAVEWEPGFEWAVFASSLFSLHTRIMQEWKVCSEEISGPNTGCNQRKDQDALRQRLVQGFLRSSSSLVATWELFSPQPPPPQTPQPFWTGTSGQCRTGPGCETSYLTPLQWLKPMVLNIAAQQNHLEAYENADSWTVLPRSWCSGCWVGPECLCSLICSWLAQCWSVCVNSLFWVN